MIGNHRSLTVFLSSVHVGVDDAGQEKYREGDERAGRHDGEVVRVGHQQPPDHDEDAPEQRVADVGQVEVVILDDEVGVASAASRRVRTAVSPGRFPLLPRSGDEAVDDAVVVEAALLIIINFFVDLITLFLQSEYS